MTDPTPTPIRSASTTQARPAPAARPGRRRGPVTTALQLLGFAVGLGLLAWVIMGAFSPANRQQLATLRDASFVQIACLLGLSASSLLVNGVIFWSALKPKQTIGFWGVQATNAIATNLALVPFKLSIVFRMFVHHRRDALPYLLITAWFGAVTFGISAATNPYFFASLGYHWAERPLDGLWLLIVIGGFVVSHAALCWLAHFFSGEDGLAGIRAFCDRWTPGVVRRFSRSQHFTNLHAAFDMLADPRWLAVQMFFRLMDLVVITLRLKLTAGILGVDIDWRSATLLAPMHFAIGTLSPAGAIGTREAGTAWFFTLLGLGDLEAFKPTLVLVLAAESLVAVPAMIAAILYLRPDRLAAAPQQSKATSDPP